MGKTSRLYKSLLYSVNQAYLQIDSQKQKVLLLRSKKQATMSVFGFDLDPHTVLTALGDYFIYSIFGKISTPIAMYIPPT